VARPGPARIVGLVLLIGYLAAAAVIVLSPVNPIRGVDLSRQLADLGLSWVTYTDLERAANVAFFLPIGLLLGLIVPWRRWGIVVAILLLVPVGIELAQGAFLPGRIPSVSDVVTNWIGSAIGLALAALVRGIAAGARGAIRSRRRAEAPS
jgi:hypothetical protein